jgi:hypothetical protein
MTTFRPLKYTEDPNTRLFRRVNRQVVGERVIEEQGPVFRVAGPDEAGRSDAVVVFDPDCFEPMRLVPVDG